MDDLFGHVKSIDLLAAIQVSPEHALELGGEEFDVGDLGVIEEDPERDELLRQVLGNEFEGAPAGPPAPPQEPLPELLNQNGGGLSADRTAMTALGQLGGPQSLNGLFDNIASNPLDVPSSHELEGMIEDMLRRA